MSKKNIIKIILDIAMVILFITFFNKDLINFKFHARMGCIFALFIFIHMFLNRKWIVNVSKKLFDKKIKLRIKISYIISALLLITIFLIILSGIFIMASDTYDRQMFWKMMHFGTSYISVALIGIHIGLYWNFVMNMFKKVFKVKSGNVICMKLARIATIFTLIFGIYTMYNQQYLTKVSYTTSYVVEHITPQDLEEPESNNYEKEFVPFVSLAATYGGIISVFVIGTYYSDLLIKRKNILDKNNKLEQAS